MRAPRTRRLQYPAQDGLLSQSFHRALWALQVVLISATYEYSSALETGVKNHARHTELQHRRTTPQKSSPATISRKSRTLLGGRGGGHSVSKITKQYCSSSIIARSSLRTHQASPSSRGRRSVGGRILRARPCTALECIEYRGKIRPHFLAVAHASPIDHRLGRRNTKGAGVCVWGGV